MKRPNFFIMGAPKCGTTALAAWLATHPNVFMSPTKEPQFFNSDLQSGKTRSLKQYEALFRKAGDAHVAVGEASTFYLFSHVALHNALAYAPDARFIAMVRNPIELARSLHGEMCFHLFEDVTDFTEAWALQELRWSGGRLPPRCPDRQYLAYGRLSKLGEQLERAMTRLPRNRLHVVVLDDMRTDPAGEYRKVLDFLGVPDDNRTQFPVINSAKALRAAWLMRAWQGTARTLNRLNVPRYQTGILAALKKANTKPMQRKPIPHRLYRELQDYFADDVTLLGRLLRRDLTSWLAAREVA